MPRKFYTDGLDIVESTDPLDNPPTGFRRLYATATSLFTKDSAGVVTNLIGPGKSGLIIRETEVDFGPKRSFQRTFIVTDADVLVTSKIMTTQSGNAATGRKVDENEMESFEINARALNGSILFTVAAQPGCSLQGKHKINYIVG